MKTNCCRWRLSLCCVVALGCAQLARAADEAPVDLRRVAPPEAHLVVYGKHNPERDYQKAYYAEVFKTLQDEKLVDRVVEIITARMTAEQLDQAKGVLEEIRTATASASWELLNDCTEVVYVQQMEMPTSQHLVVMRLRSGGAEKLEASIKNLFKLLEKYSDGKVPVQSHSQGAAEVTNLALPQGVPLHPIVARDGDVFVFGTSQSLVAHCLTMLQGGTGPSKFDDPRLAEALAQLPEPEDALAFFDGAMMFEKLGNIGDFIRSQAKNQGEVPEQAEHVAGLIDLVMDELAVLDYEVTVEYTEGNQNRHAIVGKVLPGADKKLLGMLLSGGDSFVNWQSWVPADAVAYSLNTGVRLHPFYERLLTIIQEKVPESKEGFAKWEAVQQEVGVHLDRDILQSFSGEFVSVTLPMTNASGQPAHESVFALKCENPDRIKDLLHRAVDSLNQIPAVQAQQLKFEPCADLPEFERLNAMIFAMFGVQPVVGFHDGWMVCGGTQTAVQRVLDTRAGKTPNIETSESFKRFDASIDGPVNAVSYTDLAESTRHMAQGIRQIGTFAPMVIGMIGANAKPEELKPVQEILALLPSVANVVEKFDFLEARLTVVQPGEQPDTYSKRSVTLVRPPAEDTAAN